LKLNIALPLRNESDLDQLLQQIYDPRSPSYRKFLSVQEFTERFGPSQEDYDAVIGFAEANGLTVTGAAPNRMLVDVTGPVANIEAAFHVNMGVYQHPTEDRTFYAADQEPTADLPVALWHITGLDNFSIPRPAGLRRASEAKGNATGSGPGGSFYGSDMRAAYYGVTGPTALTGSGQSVGLLEFGGYNINSVTTYFSNVKQTLSVSIVGVSTDGSSLNCTGSCTDPEQALDIISAISMAPGMSQLRVYVAGANNYSGDVGIFNKMATDNIAKSLSCSWAWSPADPTSDDPIFKEFAAQGQSLFVASGDNGSYGKSVIPPDYVYPADDVYITSVGGTDLTTNGAGGAWESETAWSFSDSPGTYASGGGISPDKIAIPTWQQTPGVITKANKGSTTYRNSPDVAAEANLDNYICYSGNGGNEGAGLHCDDNWGGTSFAAPRWAGYMALVNQQAVANGVSTVGFINPTIYSIALGASYGANFHDIISGSNGTYSAGVGYDLVTGWGSPNGTGLINSLCGAPITRYMLWAVTGGSASIWTLSGSNNFTTSVAYGPYSGWTPVSYSINPTDGTRTMIWAGTGGSASIWTLDSSNNWTALRLYGPYSGWTPVSYSYNPLGATRTLLWAGTGGSASIWTLDSSNNWTADSLYGPYSGWTPVSYSYNPTDGTRTLVWAGTGGYASIWTLDESNNYITSAVYGPYSGWTPVQYQ
jgi:kumamolisin